MKPSNPKEREIRDFLNPRAPEVQRSYRRDSLRVERELQRESAWVFRETGEPEGNGTKPSYGRKWNRDYNPSPYDTSSRPKDPMMFEETGVGALYGIVGCEIFLYMLAGWNLVDTHKEVRRKRKW